MKFVLPADYTPTALESATGSNAHAIDSDAILTLVNGYYRTRSFYLNAGTSDMTWDAGIYKGGAVKTGDNYDLGRWIITSLALAFALAAVLVIKRRIRMPKK